ncbi:MAG: N,N-dimethylformamidase beta subunit family domain-containing protein [Acidimicrobiia bacterium]
MRRRARSGEQTTRDDVRDQRRTAALFMVVALVVAGVVQGSSSLLARDSTASTPVRQVAVTRPTDPPRARPTTRVRVVDATSIGPDGVRASWVQQENARPGTNGWEIAPGAAAGIEGFADHSYAADGDTVRLYVSTEAPTFHIDAFRMGFYGGVGAREVWQSPEIAGTVQPGCAVTGLTNMVSCDNWTPSIDLALTAAFVPGDYLFKLEGDHGQQSYIPLTVWDPNSRAAYVIKNDIFTWQAWNNFGGYDFYAGKGDCPTDAYPICSRARVVSFDRPYAYGDGSGDFLGNEYPLIRFAEQHGLDVTYATDLTIQQHPSYLLDHKALLSLGHDECWSLYERVAVESAAARGVNVAFFAASPILRHVRLQPSPLGPEREEVDYRDAQEDPLDHDDAGNVLDVTANTWSSPPANWSADGFVGETYAGYIEPGARPEDFVVADASAWIYRNTGLHNGSTIPGLLASDFDQFEPNVHADSEQILGHSPISLRDAQSTMGAERGSVYSDMTYRVQSPNGAGIFDSGTNNWIPALDPCSTCSFQAVATMTGNLLWLFGQGPAGHIQPATSNWQEFY